MLKYDRIRANIKEQYCMVVKEELVLMNEGNTLLKLKNIRQSIAQRMNFRKKVGKIIVQYKTE
ncbi:MAG: hypothetical protein PHH31_07745 [Acidaminococcaceae bacterium]|nr:hypothetical protein [Acidaminococcaceae bacterium]MDD4722297.1 hypothetical protein [Acidaminococcaceae bacterium]